MYARTAIFLTALCLARVSAQTNGAPEEQQPVQSAITSVNDTKSFRLVLESNRDVLVAYTKQDVMPTELQTTLEAIDAAFPDVAIVQIVCSATTRRLCKHVSADQLTGALTVEFVLVHYRAARFNRVLRHTDEQSLVAFLANPYANPCDDDAQATAYSCVNSIRDFADALNNGSKLVTLFYATWNKQVPDAKNVFAAAAKTHADRANFIAVDVASPQTAVVAQAFDVTLFPSIVMVEAPADAQCNVYIYSGNVTNATELTEWLDNPSLTPSSVCDINNLVVRLDAASLSASTVLSTVASTITVVNESTYDTTINQTAPIVMLIYSSACRDCDNILAELQRAQGIMQTENLNGVLLIIDADQSPELTRRWKITSYPTFEYILNGQFQFIMQRELLQTAENIVAFFRLTEQERRPFRKLLMKPFLFSANLKRPNTLEAATEISKAEHTFVMLIFNSTSVEQEIQLRKAVKELSKAVELLATSNVTASVNFILLNCTATAADPMCLPTLTKNTTAAFVFNYYRNGSLTQQAIAEELLEPTVLQNASVDSLLLKVKHREILRWGSNVTGIALNPEDQGEHKHKEALEKTGKRAKKEKLAAEGGAKKTDEKASQKGPKDATAKAEEKSKEEKRKSEQKGKKGSKTEL